MCVAAADRAQLPAPRPRRPEPGCRRPARPSVDPPRSLAFASSADFRRRPSPFRSRTACAHPTLRAPGAVRMPVCAGRLVTGRLLIPYYNNEVCGHGRVLCPLPAGKLTAVRASVGADARGSGHPPADCSERRGHVRVEWRCAICCLGSEMSSSVRSTSSTVCDESPSVGLGWDAL